MVFQILVDIIPVPVRFFFRSDYLETPAPVSLHPIIIGFWTLLPLFFGSDIQMTNDPHFGFLWIASDRS